MAQLLFTKATAPSTSPALDADDKDAPKNTLASAARSINDDWEDLHNEEQENNNDVPKNSEETTWLRPDAQQHINNYGIGAKMLMAMGYQAGMGLGAKQDGIVNPIQTKLRPQGLGVGGINEKADQEDYMEVSSEDEKEIKGLNNQRIKLFNLIDELELKGVDVPRTIKQKSDSRILTYAEMSAIIEKLSLIIEEWDSLSRNEKFIFFKIKDLKRNLTDEEEEIKRAQELHDTITEVSRNKKMSLSELTITLEHLTTLKSSALPVSFVNLVSEDVEELFKECDYHPDSEFSQILTKWSELYRSIDSTEQPLSAWDSLLWKHIRLQISEAHVSNINILKYWINMPILLDVKSTICIKIMDEIIPQLGSSIAIPCPPYIAEYFKILPFCADNLLEILREIHSHYLAAVTYMADNNLWANDKLLGIALEQFVTVWSDVFTEFLGPNAATVIRIAIRNSLCHYAHDTNTLENPSWEAVFSVHNLQLLDEHSALLVFQFIVFNPLMHEVYSTLKRDPLPATLLLKKCHQWISFRTCGDLLDGCIEWYINAIIGLFEGQSVSALPTLNQKSVPSVKEVIDFMDHGFKTINIDGLPSYQIQTTFKDVVEEACVENDIVFSTTSDFHPDLGIPLYKLTNKGGRSLTCYIQDDVLWVKKGQFFPLSIFRLPHEL